MWRTWSARSSSTRSPTGSPCGCPCSTSCSVPPTGRWRRPPLADLLLRGGRLVDPAGEADATCDILIAGGRIEAVGTGLDPGRAEVIDVDGAIVAPGFVDTHVHLREPGRGDEETIASGSAAAGLGGVPGHRAPAHHAPGFRHS